MDSSRGMTQREILFHAECELQAMIAENKQREHRGESLAYTQDQFWRLGEETRQMFRETA